MFEGGIVLRFDIFILIYWRVGFLLIIEVFTGFCSLLIQAVFSDIFTSLLFFLAYGCPSFNL